MLFRSGKAREMPSRGPCRPLQRSTAQIIGLEYFDGTRSGERGQQTRFNGLPRGRGRSRRKLRPRARVNCTQCGWVGRIHPFWFQNLIDNFRYVVDSSQQHRDPVIGKVLDRAKPFGLLRSALRRLLAQALSERCLPELRFACVSASPRISSFQF